MATKSPTYTTGHNRSNSTGSPSQRSKRLKELARLAVRWLFRMTPVFALLAFTATRIFAGQNNESNEGITPSPQTTDTKDKSAYNLFNPTPAESMRELSPDRPDKTESPYTVDAGHFQLEMDFTNYTFDHSDSTRTEAWNVAPVNLKVGLLNNVDLQLVFDSYLNVRAENRVAGTGITRSGIGDFTTRLKINLWGNDGGQTAFALLPYIKFPTNTGHLGNNSVEGGVLFPLALKLPAGFEATLETGASFMQNDNGSGKHEEFVNSISVDHSIIGKLSGYVEFFSNFSTERHSSWVGTVDAGLEYAVTENIQLDCGCNIGVTHAADSLNPFTGITVRF